LKKWVKELNRTFSKEDVHMAKKTHKEMPNISGQKGKENQNHTMIPSHPC
jgi:hypothetical protein